MTKEQEALLLATAEGVRSLIRNALDGGIKAESVMRAMIDSNLALIIATDHFIQKEVR